MRRAEQTIQAAVFEHFAARGAPGVYAFHVPNGGWRSRVEAKILKGLGVRPGVPDVIAIHRGEIYALELKADNGKATDAQLQAIEDLRAAGAHAEVAVGLDAAIKQLEDWQLLRGRTQ
jgi:hypothetical protein